MRPCHNNAVRHLDWGEGKRGGGGGGWGCGGGGGGGVGGLKGGAGAVYIP